MSKPGGFGEDLTKLANAIIQSGPCKTQSTSRRVRVMFNNTSIVDTTKAVHIWEHDAYPQYYIPFEELHNCTTSIKQDINSGGKSVAAILELVVAAHDGLAEKKSDRVLCFMDEKALEPLAGKVRLEFCSMDQWLEEDLPIYVHPKDPFKRIDILLSQRPIEVNVSGKTVAKSQTSMHLLETGLPTRYYMPLTSVDQSVLRKSKLVTKCPYKGDAEYYHVEMDGKMEKNLVWYYRLPTHESASIAGLVCFYNEKVDIILDGELMERPKTFFS